MSQWVWLVGGLILLGAELVVPSGFFLFLLGIAGILVGALVSTGVFPDRDLQLTVFAVLAVALPFALTARLKAMFLGTTGGVEQKPGAEDVVGKDIKITEVVEAGGKGQGELWGSIWQVRNVGSASLAAGSKALVVNADGLTLDVKSKT